MGNIVRICIDLDGVICQLKKGDEKYEELMPVEGAVSKIQSLKDAGNYIIIYTARRMKTHKANVAKVTADIGKITLDWLETHNVPYNEVMFGKPWADIYIDDNAFRFSNWKEVANDGSSLPQSHENEVRGK